MAAPDPPHAGGARRMPPSVVMPVPEGEEAWSKTIDALERNKYTLGPRKKNGYSPISCCEGPSNLRRSITAFLRRMNDRFQTMVSTKMTWGKLYYLFDKIFVANYFKQIIIVSSLLFILSLVGILSAMVEIGLQYENSNRRTVATEALKAFNTVTSIALGMFVFFRVWFENFHAIATGSLAPTETLYNNKRSQVRLFLEMSVCTFHVPPGLFMDITLFGKQYPIETLQVLMFFRIYTAADLLRNMSGLFSHHLIALGGTKAVTINTPFALRAMLDKRGIRFVIPIIVFVVVVGTGALYFGEEMHNTMINNQWDSFYLIITTIAQVGFGDVTPETPMGRIVILVFGSIGMFVGAFATAWVFKTVDYSLPEYRMMKTLASTKFLAKKEILALKLIKRAWLFRAWRTVVADEDAREKMRKTDLLASLLPTFMEKLYRGTTTEQLFEAKAEFSRHRRTNPSRESSSANNRGEILIDLMMKQEKTDEFCVILDKLVEESHDTFKSWAVLVGRRRQSVRRTRKILLAIDNMMHCLRPLLTNAVEETGGTMDELQLRTLFSQLGFPPDDNTVTADIFQIGGDSSNHEMSPEEICTIIMRMAVAERAQTKNAKKLVRAFLCGGPESGFQRIEKILVWMTVEAMKNDNRVYFAPFRKRLYEMGFEVPEVVMVRLVESSKYFCHETESLPLMSAITLILPKHLLREDLSVIIKRVTKMSIREATAAQATQDVQVISADERKQRIKNSSW